MPLLGRHVSPCIFVVVAAKRAPGGNYTTPSMLAVGLLSHICI